MSNSSSDSVVIPSASVTPGEEEQGALSPVELISTIIYWWLFRA